MCTATWLMKSDGYELFCNRDESKTRKPALPPALEQRNNVAFVAPRDGDFGGSWIAVNEYGLSLCLLNYYPPATPPPRQQVSRGLLLISLIEQRSPDEVARILSTTPLANYRAFLLLLLAPRATPLLLKWDGERLSSESNPAMPVTTSSFDTANVVKTRREQFQAIGRVNRQTLTAFHLSRNPKGGAHSVCMSRDDAESVSLSHVSVTAGRVDFEYQPLVGTDRRAVRFRTTTRRARRSRPTISGSHE